MKKELFLEKLNTIAPLDSQEPWDNSGMQIDLGHAEVKHVLAALEINSGVIAEAKETGADMILTHHPLFFSPLRSVDVHDFRGRAALELIKADIEVYSSHTPFDKCPTGTNAYILSKLGCVDIEPSLEGIGFTGLMPNEDTLERLLARISEILGSARGTLRYTGNNTAGISKIGICTGAGIEYAELAAAQGCSVFITGDTKHHEMADAAEKGLCIIDGGHAGTEWLFAENVAEQLKALCGDDCPLITVSSVCFDPYRYYSR